MRRCAKVRPHAPTEDFSVCRRIPEERGGRGGMPGGTAVAPLALAAGDMCGAGVAGAEGGQREEGKKQVKRKQLRPFLSVPGGLHCHHLPAPWASAHPALPAIPALLLRQIKANLLHTPALPAGKSTCTNTQSFQGGWGRNGACGSPWL